MTAIWQQGEQGWGLLEPVGFEDEAALHALVADAPQVLPLSGTPRVVVLGSEVRIGSGTADLLAIEPSGRRVIIEVKLAKNAEARRAVVAQILTYAAYLRGTSRESFEQDVVAGHLAKRHYTGVFEDWSSRLRACTGAAGGAADLGRSTLEGGGQLRVDCQGTTAEYPG
jgi:RecB family endonuclease NucS